MNLPRLEPGDWKQARWMGVSAAVLAALAYLVLTFCFGGCATSGAGLETNGVPNLSQVEPGIWRGGQPVSPAGWRYLRYTLGLTNDIKLNTGDEASDRAAISAGFRLFYFPIDTLEQLIEGPDPRAMVGLYRLQEGTNAAEAWREMTNHGYHPALLGLTRFWKDYSEGGKAGK
jgi:hypothetical protein